VPCALRQEFQAIMPSIEHDILAACAEIDPDEDQLQKIRGGMSNSVDMDRLIDQAVKEGLGGFFYKSLLKAGLLETISPQHKQRLYTIYYLTVRQNVKLLHALTTILDELNKEGVDITLLQGMALLQEAYQDIGLRPMKDMDLWVLPSNYQRLVDALVQQGFYSDRLYPKTYRKGEIVLDIHTHLLWADRIKARDYLLSKSQDEIFRSTKSIKTDCGRVLCLGPQDHFLYLGLHALKHNFERLIWLVDIKALVARWTSSDWDALLKRAEELGHRKTLRYILYLLTHLFDLRLPSEIHSFLAQWKPGYLEKSTLHRRIEGRPISTWAQLMMISNGRRLRERLSFFIETLFPRPEVLRQVFANTPQLSVPQLYWRRILQVVGIGRLF
jgi:hypothetical protein